MTTFDGGDGAGGSEHLAFHSNLELEPLCAAIQKALDLPAFQLDAENETAWGFARREGVEYNVSMPYEDGTLQAWDESVPPGATSA